ncbi:MAG: ADP-glyceromanno-heptose 6-epimerase [Alphaproteobacteria bacterium]|nr:ADP-glyceromanno-heptose 6-epimerase [Alphaproteobacteria bacterium]
MAEPRDGLVVVTGGAGFIGSNIVLDLAQAGCRVVVVDHLRSGEKWRNIATAPLHDLLHPAALFPWLEAHQKSLAAIVHMGAISSTGETDIDRIVTTNIRLTLDLWQWCAAHSIRLIYASSAATYGDGSAGFHDDEDTAALARLEPLNAYGWSKHLVDRRVNDDVAAGRPVPPQWAGLKFFNVYGPNEGEKGDMRSVVSKIIPIALSGGTVTLFKSHHPDYPDGGQLRDFVYVGDCVAVVRWLLQNPEISGLFNVGTGIARSFADLAAGVFAALGRPPRIGFVDTPANLRDKYQYFTQAEIGKLRAAGFRNDFRSLENGIRDYIEQYPVGLR